MCLDSLIERQQVITNFMSLNKISLFILLLLSLGIIASCSLLSSKPIDIKRQTALYQYPNTYVCCVDYSITNRSSEPYLTWLDFDKQTDSSLSDEKLVRNYFLKNKGDFSFLTLMTDNVVFIDGYSPIIGYTFVKQLNPGESFDYYLFSDKKNQFMNDVLLPIITIPKSKVEEVLGIRISDSFLFTPSFVIIPGGILE